MTELDIQAHRLMSDQELIYALKQSDDGMLRMLGDRLDEATANDCECDLDEAYDNGWDAARSDCECDW